MKKTKLNVPSEAMMKARNLEEFLQIVDQYENLYFKFDNKLYRLERVKEEV